MELLLDHFWWEIKWPQIAKTQLITCLWSIIFVLINEELNRDNSAISIGFGGEEVKVVNVLEVVVVGHCPVDEACELVQVVNLNVRVVSWWTVS